MTLSRWRSFASRVLAMFISRRRDVELNQQIQAHLDLLADEQVRNGMPPMLAQAAARRQFGGIELMKETYRDQRGWPAIDAWVRDVRYAARMLRKRPGATIASIVTLAFSIGAGAATWSLLSALLLNPLPVRDAHRLVMLGTPNLRVPGTLYEAFTYPFYPHIRDSGIFEGVAAAWPSMELLLRSGEQRTQAAVAFATYDFFDLLGVRVPIGRSFRSEDDRRGAPIVAILSDQYWRRSFAGASDVIGRTLTVAGKPATVVGVAARGYRGLDLSQSIDLYLPLHSIGDVGGPFVNYFAEAGHASSPTAGVKLIGRLRAGDTTERAAARLSSLPTLDDRRRRETATIALTPLNTAAIPGAARAGMRQFARLLTATVSLLLLIGCSTVGMLVLVRTEARREEFAMCLALGASRARLARGVGIEGALLAVGAAVLAVPVAWWLFRAISAFQLPGGVAINSVDLSIDIWVIAVVASAAVFATLLITIVAGVFAFSADVGEALRSRAGATSRITRRRTRTVLVATQVAVALVLVAGAGLFARSLRAALSLNPGFETKRIISVNLTLEQYEYTQPRVIAFFDDLRGRLTRNPAIRSVSTTASQGSLVGAKFIIDGKPRLVSAVSFIGIDHQYFDTLGVGILQGRGVSRDDTAQSSLVGIISESFARFLADGGSAIGRRLTMPYRRPPAPAPVVEVVGVVPDVITSVTSLEPMILYLPMDQSSPGMNRTVVLRANADADVAKRETLSAIRQIDRFITPGPMLTIDERLARQMAPQQFGLLVLGALGFIAVVLTALGAYVLAESMAVMRIREMGIRAALGATGWQLGAIVLAETGRLVGLGLVVGFGITWLGANTVRPLLFQVQPFDPAILMAVCVAILALTAVVTVRPAVRAARVDLGQVLRDT